MDLVTLYSDYFEHAYIYVDKYTTNKTHFTLILLNKNKNNIPKIDNYKVHRLYDENIIKKHYVDILKKLYRYENKLKEISIALLQLKFLDESYYSVVYDKLSHMKSFVNITTEHKIK